MFGKWLGNMQCDSGRHLTVGNQWDTQGLNRNCRRHTEVGHLAETAGRFVLTVGVLVGGDLEQKQERKQGKSDCEGFGKSAQEWMRYNRHFCASFGKSRSVLSRFRGQNTAYSSLTRAHGNAR